MDMMGDTTVTGSTPIYVLILKIQLILISCAGVLILYKQNILLGIDCWGILIKYLKWINDLFAVDSFILHKYSPIKPF